RSRLDLHGRRRRDARERRLADDGVLDARRRAVRRRQLLPTGAAARHACVPPGAQLDCGGVARPARQRARVGTKASRLHPLVCDGFHRYAVDRTWLTPHFEKMLYDNAQLATSYLHGFVVHGKDRYRRVVEETVGYMLRELALDGGGFASAQDADTNGVEGLTFTWKRSEGIADELLHHFEHDRFIIRGQLDAELRERLFAEREQRPKPARDDKAIASWNGL